MAQQKRAWIYCHIDALEDKHGSLKGQERELMDYAEEMGFEIAGVSTDLGSGSDFERTGLMEVMKAAEDGKMDELLVKCLDRVGRDTIKVLEFLQGLEKLGIRLYTPLEGEIKLIQFKEIYHGFVME